jgi:hypothetical protein
MNVTILFFVFPNRVKNARKVITETTIKKPTNANLGKERERNTRFFGSVGILTNRMSKIKDVDNTNKQ